MVLRTFLFGGQPVIDVVTGLPSSPLEEVINKPGDFIS
jgi:hypothetical protein